MWSRDVSLFASCPCQQASVPSKSCGRDSGVGGGVHAASEHAASDACSALVPCGVLGAGGLEAFGLGLSV